MRKRRFLIGLLAAVTFGSGIINLLSVLGEHPHRRMALLRGIFPLEFIQLSRFLAILLGFALIVSSINIYKRKKRAFQIVFSLSLLSAIFHMTKGLDIEEAVLSLALAAILVAANRLFTVKSSVPYFRWGFFRLVISLLAAVLYGVAGFWLLHRRHFGIDFTVRDSFRRTIRFLTFAGDPTLVPYTRYAGWFLDSLYLIAAVALLYALYALFRPVLYRLRTLPHDRDRAARILDAQGRTSLDYFKLWPDKSYLFSASGQSFIAYGVKGRYAIALGDPSGPEEDVGPAIGEFRRLCEENDWRPAFYHVPKDFLPVYKELGFKKLKIGDEAIVSLIDFSLDGKRMKHFRHYINQFDKSGVRTSWFDPPLADKITGLAKDVSDSWLTTPGRRERGFTQGTYEKSYVSTTPLFAVLGPEGRMLAFVNIIPSYVKGETTIDLMRHRADAPQGIMDFLFARLFPLLRDRGFERFSLGLAPMSGFQDAEEASAEERAVHYFLSRLNFLFSYGGLHRYKSKFASWWEPRYIIYQNVLDLPRFSLAFGRLTEIRRRRLSTKIDEE
jgi:phosphatidylglycerol lysyltransferase